MSAKGKPVAAMERRYSRLASKLADLGPVLQGTITERKIVRPDPKQHGKEKTYGPYYQWTWKRDGKTVTVNLSASQARVYQKAINNHRKMEEMIQEMRRLSLAILEATTEGVSKRKALEQRDLNA
jgi:hypothetical protein